MKGKIFLYCTQITTRLQLGYKQSHYLLHLESIQCEQFFKKKKKRQGKEAEDKGERQNEGKESKMEMSEKRAGEGSKIRRKKRKKGKR